MTLYILQGCGIFADASEEKLPATVRIVRGGECCEVSLDGVPQTVRDACFTLPEGLRNGTHTLKVNGRACEGIVVKQSCVRAAGMDFRRLLPALSRVYELDERLRALEKKAEDSQVDWLK